MDYLILLGIVAAIPAQSVAVKLYQRRAKNPGDFLFTACIGLFAMFVFTVAAVSKGYVTLSATYLPYSLLFSVGYGMAFIFQILALSCGPMSLTVLIQSYSLLIPTFYGILFLDEPLKPGFVPGIILLAVCLFLINYRSRPKPRDDSSSDPAPTTGGISAKWLIFVSLSFIGNGMCSVVHRVATLDLGADMCYEFMVAAMLMIALSFLVAGLFRERQDAGDFLKHGWFYAAACGVLNGGANLAVMILAPRMPASLQYPLISAGSILFSLIFAVFLFKEKITRRQYMGVAVGILSIVCLNL